jgi:class 3 adenylate cyclase/tetratricopeptide (TPR) repeat protein
MQPNDPSAYIAQDRRSALQQGAALPDRATGAVVFADVTGFTPLAEALVRALGPRRGAEELTTLLNQVYSSLIAQVEHFGGSVITFSGDAMTCWFDDRFELRVLSSELAASNTQNPGLSQGEGSKLNIQSSATLRAVTCALAMRQAMGAFAAIPAPGGPLALRVKVALAGGPVRCFALGVPRVQLLDVLAGRTRDRLASSAQLAERDDVIVDAQTLAEIAPLVAVASWRMDPATGTRAAVIAELAHQAEPAAWPAPIGQGLAEDCVRPWLLPAVYERLRASADPFLAELRPAVALMLQFGGFDYERDDVGPQLDGYIRRVQEIVARYAGILVDITMADKGGYLYAAFGAPVAHEDDPTRALRAALELRDLRAAPEITVRIGLSQGAMRTGPYGGATRRAYGVLGDEVNLACRLMSAAPPGQILVSGRLQKALSGGFFWSALPALQVRGKHAPVEVFRLLGEASAASAAFQADAAPAEMIGRAAERAMLAEAVEALRAGSGGVVVIEGEPGIGKSRLIAELGAGLRERGLASLAGAGRSIEQQTAYRAWRDLFTSYFGLDDASEPAEGHALVQAQIRASVPELAERLPLLNDVLGLALPETPLTGGLSGRARSEKLAELLVDLLRARAARQPAALVLEDAHWFDSLSWGLAARVAQAIAAEPLALLLVVATRPLDSAHVGMSHLRALLGASGARWIRLEQLPERDTIALAAERLGLSPLELPRALVELLRERAGGNPFFAEELLATLRERGIIRIEGDPDNLLARPRCVVAGDLREVDRLLPETLQGLLLARIDRLPPEQQITLKVAAVVGPTFAFAPLQFVREQQAAVGEAQLKSQLRALSAQDYTWLEEPEPHLAYRFRHVLTQEAAYETLLYAQRRTLHRSVAEWYETTFGSSELRVLSDELPGVDQVSHHSTFKIPNSALGPYYPLLAHHYRRAESSNRERHYAWLAGIQAAEQYANAEALAFFTRTLELTAAEDLAERYAALFEREAVEELLALRDEQARDLAELEALADALGDDTKRAEIARSRARFAERVGDIATMRALARRAVALAEAAGATEVAIDAYDQLAWASMRAGDYAEAIEFAEAGLRLARTTSNRRNEAQLLTALGCAHVESENFATARECLEQSRTIFHNLGRQRGESVALGNLGEVVARQGDYVTARDYYEQALQLYRTTGDRRNEGWMLGSLGEATMQLGDYAAARAYCEQSRAIAHATGDRNTESLALAELGQIAHQLGDHAAGLELAAAGLRLAPAAHTRVHALLVVAHNQAALGRAERATASYAEAHDLAQASHLGARAAEAAAGLARIALANGDLAGALAWIEPVAARLEHDPLAGAVEPLRVFQTCYEVLHTAGDPRASAILAAGRGLLRARAALIADESLRRSFLEQVPHHRAFALDNTVS